MPVADVIVFLVVLGAVIAVALWKSRETDGEKNSHDFFLAGRGLSWWLVGFSLIAANISTEQFVGMSGPGAAHVGLAIASFEWMAAITLVVVAFCFLPYFLRAGIYTIPQFLEYRYNTGARLLMAIITVVIYMLLLGGVTYSGALTVKTLGEANGQAIPLWWPSVCIAAVAALYVIAGGLKASVWADLLQGSALIIGGAIMMAIAFGRLGEAETAATIIDQATGEVVVEQLDPEQSAYERFMKLNGKKLNMFLPANDSVLPWTALLLGLWIPNFYYWGLNQYITQRTLGSSSLAEGQKGIVFSSYLKLIIPLVVVVPGILAFNLSSDDLRVNARDDVGKAMALYVKANPETQYVKTVEAMDAAAVQAHTGPTYVIPLYKSAEAIDGVEAKNAYVLPMTQGDFDKQAPKRFQVFKAKDDLSWKHVNVELAEEIAAFNETVEAAAEEAEAKTETQALVAFKYDSALGVLLDMLPKNGLFGFVVAALLGAVISSLAAMLNAASSVFTLDIYNKLPGESSDPRIVAVGRLCVLVFALIACGLAPLLGDPNISNSIFTIIQGGQGLLSPGVLSAFAFGLIVRRAPRNCGVVAILVNIVVYGSLWYLSSKDFFAGIDFLNNYLNWMALSLVACIGVMGAMTALMPLAEPITFEAKSDMPLESSKGAWIAGVICVILTLSLYVIFSPLVLAK
ncbi:MAG: sodium/solute symporter [Planctomycetota bacterium]